MFSVPFFVEQHIVVAKPVRDVYASVADFTQWPRWSPWLCLEPGCTVTAEGKPGLLGHAQAWEGRFIGSGRMQLTECIPEQRLRYALTFLKPWKSQSTTGFSFEPTEGGTRVTWWMQGSLPFFMFFMKTTMTKLVGSDYRRGLSMLAEYLEQGAVASSLEFPGLEPRPALHYLGLRRACTLAELGPRMTEDFAALDAMKSKGTLPSGGRPLSLYHVFDPVKERCEYTAAYAFDAPVAAPEGLLGGTVPAHKAFHVVHLGAYKHLGNGWSGAMNRVRSGHKHARALPMTEFYANRPGEVPPEKLRTDLFVPVLR